MKRFPDLRPICAVCNKPVDELLMELCDFQYARRWIAVCHGQRQVVEIPERVLMFGERIEMGRAFEYQGLPKPVNLLEEKTK